MTFSSTRRSIPENDTSKVNTPFQSGSFCGNVGALTDYSGNPYFTNAIYDARGFVDVNNAGYTPLGTDGWPTSDQWQNVLSADTAGAPGVLPLGDYLCSYNAAVGVVSAVDSSNDCFIVNETTLADGVTHTFTLRVTGLVVIIKGKGGVGLTNLIIPQVGFTLKTVGLRTFLPGICTYYRQYSGIRFMEMARTNNGSNYDNSLGRWENLFTKDNRRGGYFSPGGLSLDLMVQLANEIHAIPGSMFNKAWFCIIHNATDDYITRYLAYIADNLNPSITPYIELSNETWNYSFPQASYFYDLALNSVTTYDLQYDGNTDLNNMRQRMYAGRALEVAVKAISTSAARPNRQPFRMMLCGQYASPGYYISMIDYIEHRSGANFSSSFYGLGIAPYFGPNSVSASGKTGDQLVEVCRTDMLTYPDAMYFDVNQPTRTGIKHFKQIAVQYKTKFICYEGGIDYSGIGLKDVPSMLSALRSAKWRELTTYYMNLQFGCGVDEFWWFIITPATWPANSNINFAIAESQTLLSPAQQGFRDFGNTPSPTTPANLVHCFISKTIAQVSAVSAHFYVCFSRILPTDPNYNTYPKSNSNGGLFGGYKSVDYTVYETFYSLQSRWVTISAYVEDTGNYSVALWGYGGEYNRNADGTPMYTNGSITYDSVKDAGFRWEIYAQYLNINGESLLGYMEPGLAGGQTLDILAKSNTTLTVSLQKGWVRLRVLGNVVGSYPDTNTYQKDSFGNYVYDGSGNRVITGTSPGYTQKGFNRLEFTRQS